MIDPSRVPEGRGSAWIQLQEVPFRPRGDAAGELDTSVGWTPGLTAAYTDRIVARIEQYAPGLSASVIGVHAISPAELERRNPNAEYGDPYGGSAELDQNLVFRPFPGAHRHRTAVPGLWHVGASTHPGPGLGGGSGHLASSDILRCHRRER